jgi:hypothetical protein
MHCRFVQKPDVYLAAYQRRKHNCFERRRASRSRANALRVLTTSNLKPPLRRSDSRWTIQCLTRSTFGARGCNLSPRGSGYYLLLGLVVGDGVAAGAGVRFHMSSRFFQVSPSRR